MYDHYFKYYEPMHFCVIAIATFTNHSYVHVANSHIASIPNKPLFVQHSCVKDAWSIAVGKFWY